MGSNISTPGNYNTQSLKGLAEIYTKWKFCRIAGVAGYQLQLRTGSGCRELMMLQMMAESHPKDLLGERLIQSLKISPSKIVKQVPTAIAHKNNAVYRRDCAVDEEKSLA